jgi:NAD(P)-dependent dehydrogenase (short-subunit alcohol dehydrogenase family)
LNDIKNKKDTKEQGEIMASSGSKMPTLLVIGSGPGIAVSTASLFAQKKFGRIALISRSSSRLQTDKEFILSSFLNFSSSTQTPREVQIETWAVDITQSDKFQQVLGEVEEWSQKDGDLGVECVLFNAARVDFSSLCGGFDEKEVVYDFMVNPPPPPKKKKPPPLLNSFLSLISFTRYTVKVPLRWIKRADRVNEKQTTTTALHTAFTWFLPAVQTSPTSTKTIPSFLVTSSLLWADPIPQYFSLSVAKAAQRNLVLSLQKAYPDVHIAILEIRGQVSRESKYFSPEIVAENWWEKYFSPEIVAEKWWEVYQSGLEKGTTERRVDVDILGE